MSNEEKPTESVVSNETTTTDNDTKETTEQGNNNPDSAATNIVAKIMALKESNPKVFFGGIGGGVLLILIILMMSGGDKNQLPPARIINVSVGQSYQLKGINTYDPDATVRLVAVPGSMAAYDDTAEQGGEPGIDKCKHLAQGTRVKALQLQEVIQTKYVEVEILEGECANRKGWVIAHNLN